MKNLFNLLLPLFLVVLVIGWVFQFRIFSTVQIQLHDTYFVVYPIAVMAILWVILIFSIYLLKVVAGSTQNISNLWILFFANSVMLGLTCYFICLTYVFYTSEPMAGFYKELDQPDQIYLAAFANLAIEIVVGILLVILEYSLFKKLKFK